MAVTFKVPKSPAKSIFEIDDFLGVDLTNNGTNIDEHRSPNAPNMTRYVPGKVRKRMGYNTEIVFGTGLNTNLAIGASENIDEFELNTYESGNFTTLYDLLYPKSHFDEDLDVYIEFEYMSDAPFWMTVAGRLNASPNEFTYIKTKGIIQSQYAITIIRAISYSETQTIKIRKMSVMYEQTDDYVWTKPPRKFVLENSNNPIYGCHSLKTTIDGGDFVTNVNRIADSSENYVTYPPTGQTLGIHRIEDPIYSKTHLYYAFDYETDDTFDSALIAIGNERINLERSTTETHVSGDFIYEDAEGAYEYVLRTVYLKAPLMGNLKIKKFALMYAADDNYEWSTSPESRGEKFDIGNVYQMSTEQFYNVEYMYHSETMGAGSGTRVVTSESDIDIKARDYDYIRLSGNVTMHTSYSSHPIALGVLYKNDSGQTKSTTFLSSESIDNMDFDVVVPSGIMKPYYPYKFELIFPKNPGSNVDISCTIRNVVAYGASHKTEYTYYPDSKIYHVGKNLYAIEGDNVKKIFSTMALSVSSSWQFGNYLYILDGKNYLRYTSGDEKATDIALSKAGYIPIVTISKNPSGNGGTPYDSINLIQSGFEERFLCQNSSNPDSESATSFYLSFQQLDADKVKAWVLDSNGGWVEKVEGIDFTVNRPMGMVNFISAPGRTPLDGEDNVRIVAHKTFVGYEGRIQGCKFGTLFGVNGASDRLFVSGNKQYPNYDWYSEQYDPTYFPDTGYSTLGTEKSKIMGYAIVNNYLATFKDEYEPSQSVFIREGDLITDPDTKISSPAFKLINTLQGNGVIAPHSFGYLQTEPLFLTRSGIYAITAQDITGEKYSQNRSFFLNGKLTEELNMENAYAVVYNDMYILALNNQMYILDGLQPIRTDRSEPYATRQYAAFYWTDVPALCLWTEEQKLCFGTSDGRVCEFATDVDNLDSYNDNGKPIYCCWETPDLDGQLFYKNKSFRYLAIRMMSALKTSVALYYMARGSWNFVKEDVNTGIYFDFEHIDFSAFTFSTDRTDKVAHTKIRVKKVDKARFKIENNKLNEPFGLVNLALEFVESGNYKG